MSNEVMRICSPDGLTVTSEPGFQPAFRSHLPLRRIRLLFWKGSGFRRRLGVFAGVLLQDPPSPHSVSTEL